MAQAAALSADGESLLLAAKNLNDSQVSVCRFQLDALLDHFERSWNTCQHMENWGQVQEKCIGGELAGSSQCFLFSWLNSEKYAVCQKFNKGVVRRPLDNCELGNSPSNANRFGWVENYQRLNGTLVVK